MRTDKIRKYLILSIPYLFILWAFLKLGTAYRLAAGNDFAHKLIGLGQTIGPAFADFAPGLAPLDWLCLLYTSVYLIQKLRHKGVEPQVAHDLFIVHFMRLAYNLN